MPALKKALLFLTVNFLGFSVPAVYFYIGIYTGILPTDDQAAMTLVQQRLFFGSTVTWLICAVFSVAYFFLKGKAGLMFLWAAFIIPMLYGLSVLMA